LDKWETKRDIYAADAEKTGSMADVTRHVMDGIALGQDESESMEFLRKTENRVEYNAGLNMAITNPEGLLESIKTVDGKTQIEGFSSLTSGQIVALRSNAEGTINFRKRQKDAASSALIDDVTSHAVQGTTPDQMKELLRQTVGITDKERTSLMKSYMASHSIWADKGEDPWKNTQDYNSLMEMQLRISAGLPTTEMDIWRKMLSEPSTGPKFSRSDALNLIGQLPDNKDPVMKTPFADEWMNHIDELYLEDKKIPQEDIAEWSQTRQGVEAIIRQNYPNVGKAQKEIEEFLKPAKKEKTKGMLRRLIEMSAPFPMIGPTWNRLVSGKQEQAIHVDTLEQAQALKQGEKFEYQGKVYTRR
jgi:hypothetical protein